MPVKKRLLLGEVASGVKLEVGPGLEPPDNR
jgi:hypothetical protein